ncbi:MAG: bifunctional oligoribonuclease/PAP phosphatase NrnA [Elusimicrobiota bacterium]|jgi:phosphoesterase RecJ-like protein|nr:bifunctional oligoribonuclease/PAP phosphatase NrnA [Elusimicrobiota bacterium]
MKNELKQIAAILKQSKTFFIAGHISPDGDSLGSAAALALMLNRTGKKAIVYCADPIPKNLKCINGISKVKAKASPKDVFDCAIILESGQWERSGNIITPVQAKKIINIDHHKTYENFGDVNFVDPNSSSVSELVLDVFEALNTTPDKKEAQNLYIGLLTDTGKFQNSNVTAHSHLTAAKLIELGVIPNDIERKIYSDKTENLLKFLAAGLSTLELHCNEKLAIFTVTDEMFNKFSNKDKSTMGIVNYGLKIESVKVSCLITQENPNASKLSLRSVRQFNLLPALKKLGGGGHKNAAGATLEANIEKAKKMVLQSFSFK